ncbi:isoprenoid synthase domain-containing protein, partial [Mycena vulgaris]
NVWMEVPQAELAIISNVVDMLHNASLMLDDIEDGSKLRRGRPGTCHFFNRRCHDVLTDLCAVTHNIYGIPQTVNAATYVHCLAYQELSHLASSSSLEYRECVPAELIRLHHGQGLDILWRDSFSCPTENEYIEMVKVKTGGLLRIGVRLMMACSTMNLEKDYVSLINLIGVYYQIRDDFMNL